MAGRTFAAVGDQDTSTAFLTALEIEGSANHRPAIIYVSFSCGDDAIDFQINWQIQRLTAVGTTTDITPTPLGGEITAVAAITNAGSNATIEPTLTANEFLMDINVNTRSFQQWYAQPGREMYTEQAAGNGLAVGTLHASSTAAVVTTVHFVE